MVINPWSEYHDRVKTAVGVAIAGFGLRLRCYVVAAGGIFLSVKSTIVRVRTSPYFMEGTVR
jgi:hypothetical protein